MTVYIKDFLLETPFRVEYCIEERPQGCYIELKKYAGGILKEAERCFAKTKSREECLFILERLYNNGVTPVHLSCILEDIF